MPGTVLYPCIDLRDAGGHSENQGSPDGGDGGVK